MSVRGIYFPINQPTSTSLTFHSRLPDPSFGKATHRYSMISKPKLTTLKLDKELDLPKDIIIRAESSHEGKPANVIRIPNPKNPAEEFSFTFNSVYDMETNQETLFTNEGKYFGLD